MNAKERAHYHAVLWPAACRAKGWLPDDVEVRREAVLACMEMVRGPLVTTSHPDFGPDEVTALFCWLEHIADPASLEKSARWVECKRDYKTYNRARQADWHEAKVYGAGRKNKWQRNRFGGAKSAAGGPLDSLDAKAVKDRHLTFARAHQKKVREERAATAAISSSGGLEAQPEQNRKDTHAPETEKPAETITPCAEPAPAGSAPGWADDDGVPF